jgi:hypothetical protein
MALVNTADAIGAVTDLLKTRIAHFSDIPDIYVGRPDKSTGDTKHINLFLYEIGFDPFLKNTPLNEGEKTPIWMVLKYLLTAFHGKDDSDSVDAHKHLGAAIRAVYQNGLLSLEGVTGDILKALDPNPEDLHITFDEAPVDLLAKLMQGTDEKLRLSVSFQVRPVMIAAAELPESTLLVGVDYTKAPVALALQPVGFDVIPSMGPSIVEISPSGFEVGEVVTIRGTNLDLQNLSVMLGPVELPLTMQRPDELKFKVDAALIAASSISAGSHPITVVLTLMGTGKKRGSNAVIGNLVPTLNTAAIAGPISVKLGPPRKAFATIDFGGLLLGSDKDDALLAFYRNGKVYKVFDLFTPQPAPPPAGQPTKQLVMLGDDAIEEGDYLMILRVNGQQAPQSPVVHLVGP